MKLGLSDEYTEIQLVDFPTACWIWQRGKASAGYGVLRRNGRVVLAHRAYYERFKGAIPRGWVVHHLCWNKACVNPEHLEAATLTANNQGCSNGPGCTEARDRWTPREHGPHLVLQRGDLPYTIQELGFSTPCWIWRQKPMKGGYARSTFFGKQAYAHRVFYEWSRGPVPAGLVVDHLCNQPGCVNPAHLEAVTQRENLRRKISRQREKAIERFAAASPRA